MADTMTTFAGPTRAAHQMISDINGRSLSVEPKTLVTNISAPFFASDAIKAKVADIGQLMHSGISEQPSRIESKVVNPLGVALGVRYVNGDGQSLVPENCLIQADSSDTEGFTPVAAVVASGETLTMNHGVTTSIACDASDVTQALVQNKWAGVSSNSCFEGVREVPAASEGGCKSYLVPMALSKEEPHPLGFFIEQNADMAFPEGATPEIINLQTTSGHAVDHFLVGEEAFNSMISALNENVFNKRATIKSGVHIEFHPVGVVNASKQLGRSSGGDGKIHVETTIHN